MRLWHKIFFCSFLLFEIVFNTTFLYFIQYNFNQNLSNEIDRGMTEQLILYSSLKANSKYIKDDTGINRWFVRDYLISIVTQNIQYYSEKGVYIEVLDSKKSSIYSSFTIKIPGIRPELETPLKSKRKYIIRDIGKQSFLFVTSNLILKDGGLKFTYIRDISEVYNARKDQYGLFLKLNIFIAVFLATTLYFLLKFLTRPIKSLMNSAKIITTGDYSERVAIETSDEIGALGKTFNIMAEAIEEKIEKLKQSSDEKQHFIECLAHEIKTPLTSIIGYSDFLRSVKYNEKIFIESLECIYTEGKRLESISFMLMDLILLKKHDFELKNEDISLLCLQTAEVLKPILEKKNVKLVLPMKKYIAFVQKDLFKLLLTNLLDNAIKASHVGGKISINLKRKDDRNLVLTIDDAGIGIPEEDIPRIFEPFFMVDRARTRSNQGAGLGLAICAEVIKIHKGNIAVSSKFGVGTTVEVILP